MKKTAAIILFISVLISVGAPIASAQTYECYVISDRYYDIAPAMYDASLSPEQEEALLGTVTAKYESNGNPGIISSGNGDVGGASFGAYQFASRAGTPLTFANWCVSSGRGTLTGQRLIAAYSADGNTYGDTFKSEWKALAAEDADAFMALQHAFVKVTYYDAVVARVEKNISGFDMDIYGIALKNVFWSRAVQHGVGGAYNVISRAFSALGGFAYQSEEILIRAIYAESGALSKTGTNVISGTTAQSLGIDGLYMKYYSGNSSSVQVSVYRRLQVNELTDILNMLSAYGGYVSQDMPAFELSGARARHLSGGSAQICGFLYNYGQGYVSEYGILAGKNEAELQRVSLGGGTSATVLPIVGQTDMLIQNRAYIGGVYAVVDGEYRRSPTVPFITGEVLYHTVTFKDLDGNTLDIQDVQNGDSAVYGGEIPKKPSDNYFDYSFSGWSEDISSVTRDMTVIPLFKSSPRLYTVTFYNHNGDILQTAQTTYGGSVTYTSDVIPSRLGNSLYRKVFSGWDKELSSITSDTAVFPMFDDISYLWSGKSAEGFSGGDGSEASPYLICSAEELALFAALVNGGRGDICGILTENIVLNRPALLDSEELRKTALAFTPIGSESTPFSGSFDGGGFKIVGLVSLGDDSGLFGVIDGGAVCDLIIEKVYSSGKANAGGLAGRIRGDAEISNVAVYGTVISEGNGGMLCGSAEGGCTIEDIYGFGTVSGKVSGGITGSAREIGISRVFSQCTLDGESAGGVSGKWQAILSFSSCFYEAREGQTDIIALPVANSALQNADAYHGLPSSEKWEIASGGARLTLDSSNGFNYEVFGDYDLDGKCTAADAVLLAQFLAHWDISKKDHDEGFDMNGDSMTDAKDSVLLAQKLAGWKLS